MKKPKHTPGPWWGPTGYGEMTFCIMGSDDFPVCEVHGEEVEEGEPNARLIAAAPDMYEALRAAEEYMAFNSTPCSEPYPLQSVRAALAKAEGRE